MSSLDSGFGEMGCRFLSHREKSRAAEPGPDALDVTESAQGQRQLLTIEPAQAYREISTAARVDDSLRGNP